MIVQDHWPDWLKRFHYGGGAGDVLPGWSTLQWVTWMLAEMATELKRDALANSWAEELIRRFEAGPGNAPTTGRPSEVPDGLASAPSGPHEDDHAASLPEPTGVLEAALTEILAYIKQQNRRIDQLLRDLKHIDEYLDREEHVASDYVLHLVRQAQRGGTDRLTVNAAPLKSAPIPVCRGCGKRAPWCSCGAADYGDADD